MSFTTKTETKEIRIWTSDNWKVEIKPGYRPVVHVYKLNPKFEYHDILKWDSVGFLALEGEILEIKETSLGNLLISASNFDFEYWA